MVHSELADSGWSRGFIPTPLVVPRWPVTIGEATNLFGSFRSSWAGYLFCPLPLLIPIVADSGIKGHGLVESWAELSTWESAGDPRRLFLRLGEAFRTVFHLDRR